MIRPYLLLQPIQTLKIFSKLSFVLVSLRVLALMKKFNGNQNLFEKNFLRDNIECVDTCFP